MRLTKEQHIKWVGDFQGVPTMILVKKDGTWIRQGKDNAIFIPPMSGMDDFINTMVDLMHRSIEEWPMEEEIK